MMTATGTIIYNVTIMMEWDVHEAWLEWMMNIHIPEVLGTGCFERHQLVRLLEVDETDGPTYAAQYYASSMEKYRQYINQYATELRSHATKKWGDQVLYFRSLMTVVQ